VEIGTFLGEVLNFLIIAAAIFVVMVKVLGAIRKAVVTESAGDPATKECPLCLSNIPYKAKKCGHCSADLPHVVEPATVARPGGAG
jgi:large conductance mechanosensitive channel